MFLKAKWKDAPFCTHNLALTMFFHIQKEWMSDNHSRTDRRHCRSTVSSEKKSKMQGNYKTLNQIFKSININSIREKGQNKVLISNITGQRTMEYCLLNSQLGKRRK